MQTELGDESDHNSDKEIATPIDFEKERNTGFDGISSVNMPMTRLNIDESAITQQKIITEMEARGRFEEDLESSMKREK